MNWDDARLFLAVARTGQLLAASRRLGVNHATLSRRDLSRAVALVPQSPQCPPEMPVADYVLLGRTPFISYLGTESRHDLDVVEFLCDRVIVLYLGKIMEIAPTETLYHHPRHPYTQALLAASPIPDPAQRRADRPLLTGDIPSPANPPSGCVFRTRRPYTLPACAETVPPLAEVAPGHWKACLRDDLPTTLARGNPS